MAHLIVREPGQVAVMVDLDAALDIGRDAENGLVLADRQASRRHARLAPGATGWRLVDLGSKHGTFVNGARVDERQLEDGDQVQIGRVLLVFRAGTPGHVETSYGPTDLAPVLLDPAARRLGLLVEASRVIGQRLELDDTITRMLDAILDVLGGARAVVGLSAGGALGGRRISRCRGGLDEPVLSRAHLEALLVRRERLLAHPPGGGSAMAAPLLAGERVLGFLYVDGAESFADRDLDYFTALAHLLAGLAARGEEDQRLGDVAAALRAAQPRVEMLGDSPPMAALRARMASFAVAGVPVLIRGESGTGKELVAGAVHALSPRADGPFVTVNCAALPETLLESELFGHEKGAFSGAVKRRRGRFAMAHRGTIFLDEIGDLSLAAQAKILRVLEDGEVTLVGGETAERVDVRLLAATHKPLESEIAAGRFREDLFYRLSVGELWLPPLRERGDDLLLLARHFLARAARRMGKPCPELGPGAVEAMRRYEWPGNVRQLQNEMERAAILSEGTIERLELRGGAPSARREEPSWEQLQSERNALDEAERRVIVAALRRHGGVVARAARELGVPRTTLASRVAALGIAGDDG